MHQTMATHDLFSNLCLKVSQNIDYSTMHQTMATHDLFSNLMYIFCSICVGLHMINNFVSNQGS